MDELKNCENCKHRRIRRSRGYPCMCCELLNPISFNSKWEEEPSKQGEKKDKPDMDSFIRIFEEDDKEDGMDSFIRILKD